MKLSVLFILLLLGAHLVFNIQQSSFVRYPYIGVSDCIPDLATSKVENTHLASCLSYRLQIWHRITDFVDATLLFDFQHWNVLNASLLTLASYGTRWNPSCGPAVFWNYRTEQWQGQCLKCKYFKQRLTYYANSRASFNPTASEGSSHRMGLQNPKETCSSSR